MSRSNVDAATLVPLQAKEARAVREFFREAGYTTENLTRRFGATGLPAKAVLQLFRSGVPLEETPLNVLFLWHWVGLSVEETLSRLVPAWYVNLGIDCGLLRRSGERILSDCRLSPFADLLVASDHVFSREDSVDRDVVLWPNPTTLLVYHSSIRKASRATLDLGTGSGILGIAAAQYSSQVVATDLNARAAEFVGFNAALNEAANIEALTGDSFEPVDGRKFDLILANPPFFVTPKFRQLFSDNPMELDGFCRKLVREAPFYLEEGGYLQMLCEWVEISGQPWEERIAEWLDGLGCDAWVVRDYARSAADYSMIRVEEKDYEGPGSRAAVVTEWLEYFTSRNVREIHGGFLVLRKRTGARNWTLFDSLDRTPTGPFGETIVRIFESRDAVERLADDQEALLASRPSVSPDTRLEQQLALNENTWSVVSIELKMTTGLRFAQNVDPSVAEFLELCDGARTFQAIVEEIAARHSLAPGVVQRECWKVCRGFLSKGLMQI